MILGPSGWGWRPKLRWFAAEYLIVVLGVLTAVGINAWWQGRQDAAGERSYLTLIDRDLHQMEANLQQLVDYEAQQFQGGLRAYRILSAPAPSDEEQVLASESLSHLLSRRTMNPTDATYQDLLSTGSLRLLRNRALRDRLVAFYVAFYEEAERTFDIHNRNNAVFVDDLFAHELLGRGLLYGRAGSADEQRFDTVGGAVAAKPKNLAPRDVGFEDRSAAGPGCTRCQFKERDTILMEVMHRSDIQRVGTEIRG